MDGKSIRQKVLWERNSLFIMIKKKKKDNQEHVTTVKHI